MHHQQQDKKQTRRTFDLSCAPQKPTLAYCKNRISTGRVAQRFGHAVNLTAAAPKTAPTSKFMVAGSSATNKTRNEIITAVQGSGANECALFRPVVPTPPEGPGRRGNDGRRRDAGFRPSFSSSRRVLRRKWDLEGPR